jgi:AbrB family looped-hinge helix DNA binding protein
MYANTSSKGQIVIPSALRRKYGIKKGTRVEFREEGGKIVLLPHTLKQFDDAVKRVQRRFAGIDLISALQEERRQEVKKEERGTRGIR